MAPGHKTTNEDKRWLIVGAYHTGVPEKTVARISGLSTTAVRQIYLNHQQTGTPSLPKQLSRRIREKPIVEYDEDGNLIDDCDEDSDSYEDETAKRRRVTPKRSQSIKISRQPTTKDVIAYVVQQVHHRSSADNQWEVASSTTESTPSLSSSPVLSTGGSWRPLTPPREATHDAKTPLSPPVHFPPSPPHHQHIPHLPPVGKFEQTIRGCELWTREDDRILIEHMLDPAHGERWRELEAKLEGRHTARLCSHRWDYLQTYFLKALQSEQNERTPSADSADAN